MTPPAFTAERRRLLHRARSYQSISPANRAPSNPPATAAAFDRWNIIINAIEITQQHELESRPLD